MATATFSRTAAPPAQRLLTRSLLTTGLLVALGGSLLVSTYGSVLALLFPLLLAAPVAFYLLLKARRNTAEVVIFARSFAIGLLAAGIASYYAIVLLDPFQLASDASSFFELSSQAGPARSVQDLQTVTEGAGAVVLWSWFYNAAAAIGFPREPYVGISVNIVLVAMSAFICSRIAQRMYGDDEYRSNRLVLFFSISGNMWLFAGLHIRDGSILFVVMLLCYWWIDYLAQLRHRKLVPAALGTLVAMPILQVLRAEFFYVPMLIGILALLCLNFSRGRGDNRFITLVSILFGLTLIAVAVIAFGDQIQAMFATGQQGYSDLSLQEARSGSLGAALIVEQAAPIRIALGVPYLYYFPIPAWAGFADVTAILLFKSINALSFYFLSGFLFAGIYMILTNKQLRSPAFLFALAVPLAFSVSIALTSLESRHLGVFLPLFYVVALLPDLRADADRRLVKFTMTATVIGMIFIHLVWFALRYA